MRFFWTVLLFPLFTFSAELEERWISIRAMGMGNAYTAIVDDGDALFYNPANLCRVEGYNWTFMDLGLAANGLQAAEQVSAIAAADDISDYSDLFGTDINIYAGSKTAVFTPCFGFTAWGSGITGIQMKNPVFPVLSANYLTDYGVKAGYAVPLGPGLSFGMAVSRITRQGGEVPFGPGFIVSPDASTATDSFQNKGIGYGMDLGFTWAIPAPVEPVLTVVWKNVGYTGFALAGGTEAPDIQQEEIIFGFALDVDTALVRIVPTIDFKHVNRADEQFGKKVHLGLEVDLPLVAVRGGFHQGYWTVGAGMDLWVMRFDVASWAVEQGVYPGQDEDRRFAAQITFELGFDAGFSFSGFNTNANRRRLKQRR